MFRVVCRMKMRESQCNGSYNRLQFLTISLKRENEAKCTRTFGEITLLNLDKINFIIMHIHRNQRRREKIELVTDSHSDFRLLQNLRVPIIYVV